VFPSLVCALRRPAGGPPLHCALRPLARGQIRLPGGRFALPVALGRLLGHGLVGGAEIGSNRALRPLDPVDNRLAVPDGSVRDPRRDLVQEGGEPVVVIEDKTAEKRVDPPATKPTKTVETPTKTTAKAMPPEKKPDPLASIRLIILLKDGSLIERPMSEVSKFSVDKGILVVVAKDGRLSRFSILDVAKVTIE